MAGDGAHLGVGAGRALETIIGDAPQPSEDEQRTPYEMRDWLLAAEGPPWQYDDDGYTQCARYIGRQVLEAYLDDWSLVALPMDTEYDWQGDPDHGANGMKPEYVNRYGLHDVLVERGADITGHGITGFQWGWAVNAARYAIDADAQANPAIVDVGPTPPEHAAGEAFAQLQHAATEATEAVTSLAEQIAADEEQAAYDAAGLEADAQAAEEAAEITRYEDER